MKYKHPKIAVVLDLSDSEAEAIGFLLNKGYGTQVMLKWAAQGGTLELSANIDSEADYPDWGPVEAIQSKESISKEFEELKSEYFQELEESNKLLNGEDIPF